MDTKEEVYKRLEEEKKQRRIAETESEEVDESEETPEEAAQPIGEETVTEESEVEESEVEETETVLFGILWELNPDKIGEVMDGYKHNEFQIPEGLKIIDKWLHSETKCIEVVEVEEAGAVDDYVEQFDEFGTYEIVMLVDAREAIPGLVF